MVCCVIVAMLFALPFILLRGLYGLVSGSSCSMAWRPAALSVATNVDHRMIQPAADTTRQFTVSNRVKSFGHAGRGAVRLLRFEHSAWIQLSIAAVAVLVAVALQISAADWRWIVVACGLVLSLEGLNTAVERTCDRISLAYCGEIKVAKDVAAGAVLLGSIAAAIIGLLTFLPYLGSATAMPTSLLSTGNPSPAVGSAYSQFAVFHCHSSVQSDPGDTNPVAAINGPQPRSL